MARNGWMRCADRNSEADAVEAMAGAERLFTAEFGRRVVGI